MLGISFSKLPPPIINQPWHRDIQAVTQAFMSEISVWPQLQATLGFITFLQRLLCWKKTSYSGMEGYYRVPGCITCYSSHGEWLLHSAAITQISLVYRLSPWPYGRLSFCLSTSLSVCLSNCLSACATGGGRHSSMWECFRGTISGGLETAINQWSVM